MAALQTKLTAAEQLRDSHHDTMMEQMEEIRKLTEERDDLKRSQQFEKQQQDNGSSND